MKQTISKTSKTLIALCAVSMFLVVGAFFTSKYVYGVVTRDITPLPKDSYRQFSFFTATTTTATSTNISNPSDGAFRIAGAKKVNMYFSRGGATNPNTGSTVFKVQVTPDGTSWYDWNRLIPNIATSTNTTGVVDSDYKVSSVTITAATSTSINTLDLRGNSFYAVRCIAVETTDGEHTCSATAEF